MIEPMAEGHLLKSSGRVLCQGQQVFYELLLSNAQHLLKFYDSVGKVRLIRPVLLPALNLEVHGVGEYLLCYEPAGDASRSGSFYLVRLSNLKARTERFNLGLRCSPEEGRKIRHSYCSVKDKRIVFSDAEENVYLAKALDGSFEVKYLYKHEQEISDISIDECQNLLIVNKDGGISILQLDQEEQVKVPERKDEPNVVQYFHGDGFVVHYATRRQWRSHHQEQDELQNYFLLINDEGKPSEFEVDKFYYQFEKNSEILIKSGRNYLIVFNKTQNIIITVHNGLQRVTEVTDNLMSEIEQNNFVINFKVDESFNVMLEIRVFVKIQQEFTLHQYQISKKQGIAHKNYLKRNLHNIFQFNGLILPLYEAQVKKQLNNFINSLQQYKNSKESRMFSEEGSFQNPPLKSDMSPYELSVTLLKVSLQHFPSSLDRLIRKIRNNLQFNKSICYVETTYRYFEFCHFILEEFIEVLANVSRSIDDAPLVNGSLNSRDKEEIDKIYAILENMINFLFGLISALKIEISDQERMNRGKQSNKKQEQRFAYYEKVYNIARSFFLIVTMLEDEEILAKFDDRFQRINKGKDSFAKLYKNNAQLLKLQYEPLFLHEHFALIELLPKQDLSFTQFIQFMLANRQNYVQNAYFYQSITKNASTPYLQTDISDLIENICFHLPLMKKESIEEGSRYQQTKELLRKMTGTVLKLNIYPFLKYMIQVNVCYQEFPLAIMLIFSDSLRIPGGYQITENIKNQHLFMIKSLILCNRIDLAQIYVLDHYDIEISEEFLKYAKTNGNVSEVLELYQKKLVLTEPQKLKQLLQIEDSKWNILFGQRISESLPNESSPSLGQKK